MKKLVLAGVLIGLIGCGSDTSPSEPFTGRSSAPLVTVSGVIQVTGAVLGGETTQEVILSFFEPGDTLPRDQKFLPWNGLYRVEFWNGEVCGWSLAILIWDGRESEKVPLFEEQPPTCAGDFEGPTFWFP